MNTVIKKTKERIKACSSSKGRSKGGTKGVLGGEEVKSKVVEGEEDKSELFGIKNVSLSILGVAGKDSLEVSMPGGEEAEGIVSGMARDMGCDYDGFVGLGDDVTLAKRFIVYLRKCWIEGGDRDGRIGVLRGCKQLGIDVLRVYGWLERDGGFKDMWEFLESCRRRHRAAELEELLTQRAIDGWEEVKERKDGDGNMVRIRTRKQDNRLGIMLMQAGNEVYSKDAGKPVGVSWSAWRGMQSKLREDKAEGEVEMLPSVTLCTTREAARKELGRRIEEG